MKNKIYLRNADLEDREKKNRIFNPETGINEDGTMSDCLFRPWINQPKKERKMTREEAIEQLKNIRSVPSIFIDETIKGLVEALEKPLTLADLLVWEEGVEYDYKDLYVLKVENNRLFMKSEKCSSGWCNFAIFGNEIEDLRQAKKVEAE